MSLRGGLKAADAQKASRKRQRGDCDGDTVSEGGEGGKAPALTRDMVFRLTILECKALAKSFSEDGKPPWGSSKYTSAQWRMYCLQLFGLDQAGDQELLAAGRRGTAANEAEAPLTDAAAIAESLAEAAL